MSRTSTPERRRRLSQSYQRPDSPYPVPQAPFRQTFALTSPRREEPILVNIGIDPKPIIDTENGERFICDISLDVQPGGSGMLPQTPQAIGGATPFQLDMSADSDRTFVGDSSDFSGSSERTLVDANSPIARGYDISPEVTPTSFCRECSFTSSTEMGERLPQQYRRPDSPYPIPQTPDRRTNVLSSPCQHDWSVDSDRTLVNEMSDFPSSIERTLVQESTPKGILKKNIRDAPSPEPSPVMKQPFYRPRSQMSDYYGSYSEPPPAIIGPRYGPQSQMSDYFGSFSEPYRPQFQMSDSYGSSSDALNISAESSHEGTFEKSYSPIIRRRRRVRYDIPHTSTELYTPRGISKGRRRRRIPGRRPIPELPWSPTYLPEDARSPVSGVTTPPHWINRTISWEQPDEVFGASPEPSPVIKRPLYAPTPSYSDRSSPSPVIKPPSGYQPPSDEIYSDYDSTSSPVVESYDRHQSPFSDRSSSLSPVIKPPFGYQPSSDESSYDYESSPSTENEPCGGCPSPDWDNILPIFYPDSGHNRQ